MEDYKNNLDEEIILLKKNLMSVGCLSTNQSDFSKAIKDSYFQLINEEKGKHFENNIREILQEKFGWKPAEFSRDFYFREIVIGQCEKKIVSVNFPQNIEFKNESYNIIMEENGKLSLINKNKANSNDQTIIDGNDEILLKYKNVSIFISKVKHFEMDGSFKLNEFDINMLNKKDASIFFNGIKKNEEFNYIVIEAKLKKYLDLFQQLKRDNYYLKKMTNQKILYCGFLNLKELDYDVSNYTFDFSCIIIGVDSYFFGKDITKFYDWTFMKDTKNELVEIKGQYEELKRRVGRLENHVQELTEQVKKMDSKLDLLLEKKTKKTKDNDIDQNVLNKKRKLSDSNS
jgi:hypothetical protein